MVRKIAVSTNKGGVLKTSIVSNIAGIYAKAGKRVLIVDADNQGNISVSFGVNPDTYDDTIYNVMMDKSYYAKAALKNVADNIDMIASNDDLSALEFEVLPNRKKYPKPFFLLKSKIEQIVDMYDIILFDTPPNLGLATGNVLAVADEVLIPFQPEPFSMRSLLKILKNINDFKELNPDLKVLGVVPTLVDKRTTVHKEILQQLNEYCKERNIRRFKAEIPRQIDYVKAVAYYGLPMSLITNRRQIIKAYHTLKEEIDSV